MLRAELYEDWCQKKRSKERATLAQLPAFVTKGSWYMIKELLQLPGNGVDF